jgi:NADH-quinone oxidoreductase subunit J
VTGGDGVAAIGDGPNVEELAHVLFTDYVFAFEITSLLLTIAVIGAVVLAKRGPKQDQDLDEEVDA